MHVPCWPNLLIAAVFLALTGCAIPRGDTPLEGAAIAKVSVRHMGPKSVEEDRLRTHIRTTAGSRYRSERIDEDIKALYESGLVNDVRVLAEPGRRGVEVIFEVQTRGRMVPPGFVGNTVFSDHRLLREANLPAGEEPDRASLDAAARKIEAFYRAHGYADANVTTRTDVPEPFVPPSAFFVDEGSASDR